MLNLKTVFFAFMACLLPAGLMAQPCYFPGDDARWDWQFARPGITAGTVQAMLPLQDGTLLVATSFPGSFGGNTQFGTLARWDGQRFLPFGGTLYGNPSVSAAVQDAQGNIYIGGFFSGGNNPNGTQVPSQNVIRWNVAQQRWEAVGTGVNDRVNALAIDQDTLYLAGRFTATQAVTPLPMSRVGKFVMTTGTFQALGGGVAAVGTGSGEVNALATGANGQLFVGGSINRADGDTIFSIARWRPGLGWDDMDGGLPSFGINGSGQPTGSSSAANVQSLAYDAATGKLYAGGTFGQFIGSAGVAQIKGFAVWDGTTWTLIPCVGVPISFSAYSVHALAIDPVTHKVYLGGTFVATGTTNPLNTSQGNGIMAYDPATQTYDNLEGGIVISTGIAGTVLSIGLFQGRVYAGGSFAQRQPTGDFANNLIVFDPVARQWDNLGNGINDVGQIFDAVRYNNDLMVAGSFARLDNLQIPGVAKWNPATGWDTVLTGFFGNINSNFNSTIYTLYRENNDLYIGGVFGGVGNITTTSIIRYNLISKTFTSWGTGLGGTVPRADAFIRFKNELYVAGSFTSINGTSATHISKLTPGGWVSVGSINSSITALANAGDSVLYVVGNFSQVNGNAAMNKIARYDGTAWTPVGQGINNGTPKTVAIHPLTGDVYVGGNVSSPRQSNGQVVTAQKLLRWDGNQWSQADNFVNDASFTNINHMVFDAQGTMYLTGGFRQAGGQTVNSILRWNPSFGLAGFGAGLNADPAAAVNSATTDAASRIVLADSFMFVVGTLFQAGNNQSSRIARYRLDDPASGAVVVNLGPDITSCTSVTLNAGAPGASYVWNTGDQTQSITASTTGWYSVLAFRSGCLDEDSVFVTIVQPDPVFVSDTVSGCNEVIADAGSGYISYYWSDGSSGQSVPSVVSRLLTVQVIDVNGCVVTDSVYANVTGYDPSAFVMFTVSGDTTVVFDGTESFGADTYFWDFGDGNTGTGETVTHTYLRNDTFTVTLIVTNACGSDTFQTVVVVDFLTSLDADLRLSALEAYPNPANATVFLRGETPVTTPLTIRWMDLQGRVLQSLTVRPASGQVDTRLSVPETPGMYFLQVVSDAGAKTFPVVVR